MAEKKIESTFEAPRDIYEIVFNSANDGILLADVEDKRFLMANNKICKMLGYTREEILKLSIADLHPKESLPQVMEEFGKQVRGETEIASNLPVRRQDGSIFFADINSVPITISGKRLMLGMFRDVTERKKAEEKVKTALDYSNAIIATAREPILVLDRNMRVISTNSSFCTTFRVTEKETIGRYLPDLGNKQWNISSLIHLLKEILPKKTVVENYDVEHDFETIGHRIMNLNARQLRISKEIARAVTAEAAEEEEEELILLAIEDVTERKKAEEALKEKIKELEIFHDATVDRELKMEEMRKKVKELEEKLRGKNG
jgi:PAS domain S-box-containing protein